MSFASYFEDIQEFRSDLLRLQSVVDDAKVTATEIAARIRAFSPICERLIEQCTAWLDLATDPDIQLADQLAAEAQRSAALTRDMLKERREHERALSVANRETARLAKALSVLKAQGTAKSAAAARDAAALQTEITRLRETIEFERQARHDFGSMVDRFAP